MVEGDSKAFCPVLGNDPHKKLSEEYKKYVEGCPAFQNGCPFKNLEGVDVNDISNTIPSEVFEKLKTIPSSHLERAQDLFREREFESAKDRKKSESPRKQDSGWNVVALFGKMHGGFMQRRAELGFGTSSGSRQCPFRNHCSKGEPLLETLDRIVQARILEDAQPLSSALKESTKEVHMAVESMHFMQHLVRGKLALNLYVDFLKCLLHIYSNLEEALSAASPTSALIRAIEFHKFARVATLLDDVNYLAPITTATDQISESDVDQMYVSVQTFAEEVEMSAATKMYVNRLKFLAREDPDLLVAHAYVRYLGDLSGGQVLSRAVRRSYGLSKEDKDGVKFYQFEGDVKELKANFRNALDSMKLSTSRVDEVVQEAEYAFALNAFVFEVRFLFSGFQFAIRIIILS